MRIISSIAAAGALVLLTGCASTPKFAMLEPVGPSPAALAKRGPDGRLQIYTAQRPEPIRMEGGEWWRWDTSYAPAALPRGLAHSGYTIRSLGGHPLKYVRNARNGMDPTPTIVTLSPGEYEVAARAMTPNGNTTRVLLTVQIEPGKATVVHLSGIWQPKSPYLNKQVVRLPDGQIAGWLAAE